MHQESVIKLISHFLHKYQVTVDAVRGITVVIGVLNGYCSLIYICCFTKVTLFTVTVQILLRGCSPVRVNRKPENPLGWTSRTLTSPQAACHLSHTQHFGFGCVSFTS